MNSVSLTQRKNQADPVWIDGNDLRIGDTIEVWWAPNRDTIIGLAPYKGPLEHLWSKYGGAAIGRFALMKGGMTIEPQIRYLVFSRSSAF